MKKGNVFECVVEVRYNFSKVKRVYVDVVADSFEDAISKAERHCDKEHGGKIATLKTINIKSEVIY
ncbi:hypothetical protein [uncultured Arcobacter sp.]|uniref:hypothetical protein n=1 Tax=uncultured Arcobacter sp. TaxID=165434 RepID=UPI0026347BA6|nr:hypothetical protein [uncultured Arcobacter sp.]